MGLEAVGVEYRLLLLTRPMDYTTACTTVRAVILEYCTKFGATCGRGEETKKGQKL